MGGFGQFISCSYISKLTKAYKRFIVLNIVYIIIQILADENISDFLATEKTVT